MKPIITSLIIASLIFGELSSLAMQPAPASPDPKACLFCILVVIGVVVCGVMIYGLIKMCKNIPAPPPDPQTNNVPPNPAVSSSALPPLTLPNAPGPVTLQSSSDGATWVSESTFNVSTDGKTVTVTSTDNAGHSTTNTAPVYLDMSQGYFASANFTNSTKPQGGPRFYRLVSAVQQ